MTPQEAKLAMIADAVRGAMVNLKVALQMMGEMQGQGAEEKPDPLRPKMFGARGQGAGKTRPTAAVGAEPPSTEG